jgi:hypothetical protein
MEEQLPLQHLVIMLLERSSPSVSCSELPRREPFIQLNCVALLEKVDDHLTVADALAIQLDPGVLALRTLAGVCLKDLFIGKLRQLEPSQAIQSNGPTVGKPQSGAKVKTFRVAMLTRPPTATGPA